MYRQLRVIFTVFLMVFATNAFAQKATSFSLRDINNKTVSLADYDGQVVLISFWATWCGPCKVEMPHLNKLYNEKKDEGFVVLSISSDDARSASKVKPYIRKMGYTFPVLLDKDSAVTGIYNPLKILPYTVILDRSHNIAKVHSGFNPGEEVEIAHEVTALLKK
jgi:peroxiredoxin